MVGQTLSLNSKKYTVIGVAPETFRYPSRAQLWIPLDVDSKSLGTRGSHWVQAIGRMKPGVNIRQAQADLTLIASRLEQQYPDSNYKVGASVVSLHEDLAGKSRSSLLMMLSAVGLVLLIACANVANLLLSRAVARQKEMAVRGALGAGRWRLVQQLLTESLLLAAIGGVLGLGLGWAIIALFTSLKSFAVPQFNVIRLNGVAMAFTFAVALLTGALFGIFPALQTARPDLHEELKGGAGSSVSPGRRRRFTSNALVAGEIALSLLLLVSAGLLLKDFARLRSMDIGVRTDGVWTAALRLPEADYATDQQRFAFAQSLLEQARGIPGVETAALSDRMPLEGGSNYYATVRGRPFQRMSGPLVETHSVSPDYFRVMGVRLLQGRVFTPGDIQAAMALDARMRPIWESGVRPSADVTNAVVYPSVINQAMARHFWPNEDPLGQMFSSGNQNGPWRQVIGVVSDVRQWGITHVPVPEAYEAIKSPSRLYLVLRTSMAPVQPDVSGARGGGQTESRAAADFRANHGGSDRRQHTESAVSKPAGGFVCGVGGAAGRGRHLWRALLRRDAAHARDRHPDLAWREPGKGAGRGAAPGRAADRRGFRDWHRGRIRGGEDPHHAAPRGEARRPIYPRCDYRVAGRGCADRLLHPGAARRAARPDERTAPRMRMCDTAASRSRLG